MAFFTAIGTISNDIVRRETKNGVVATFRLETGAPRGRRLWIDVECWGHLAGTIARFGATKRTVLVSGRLVEKSWRDQASGDLRVRHLVRASEVDLLASDASPQAPPNHLLIHGRVAAQAGISIASRGCRATITVADGRARSKGGSLKIRCRVWSPDDASLERLISAPLVCLSGSLEHHAEGRIALSASITSHDVRPEGSTPTA